MPVLDFMGHGQPLGYAIDGDNPLGPEKDRAADRHLADWTTAPNGHCIRGLDVALNGCLPAGRENVAEE